MAMKNDQMEDISLKKDIQLELFSKFKRYYSQIPFTDGKNESFEYEDAITLYSMIRYFKPKNLIKVSCDYSNYGTLNINKLFLNNELNCAFIERYRELLSFLFCNKNNSKIKIIYKNLQKVNLNIFHIL